VKPVIGNLAELKNLLQFVWSCKHCDCHRVLPSVIFCMLLCLTFAVNNCNTTVHSELHCLSLLLRYICLYFCYSSLQTLYVDPLASNKQHSEINDCLEDNRDDY